MVECFNSHFQVFLADKGVYKSILLENPVPLNVSKPQVNDDFLTTLMTKAQVCSALSLKKIHRNILKIMGPLPQVWKSIENVKNDSTGEITLPLE